MNFKLFKNRNFALFIFGQATSAFGTIFLNVSLALYVLRLTGSVSQFTFVVSLGVVPLIVLGPLAGVVVDRFDRRKMVMLLDFVRGIYLVLLFPLFLSNLLSLTWIYASVLLLSTCEIFFGPAFQTILPSILQKEDLVSGNSLMFGVMEATNILAPLLGTVVYSAWGLGCVLLVDGITFLVSAFSEYLMQVPPFIAEVKKVNIFGQMRDGVKVFFRDGRITSLVSNGLLTHLFLMPFILIGFPYMIIQVFSGTSVDYGIVESCATVGALISVVIVGLIRTKVNVAQGLGIGMLGMLAGVLFMTVLGINGFVTLLESSRLLMVLFFCLAGLIIYVSFNSYGAFFAAFYQQTIPNELMGRFVAMLGMFFAIARLLGFQVFEMLFSHKNLLYPVLVVTIGMILKLLVHIPFLRLTKKIETAATSKTKEA